jgi:succinoglycan biosynthesis protein ExoM
VIVDNDINQSAHDIIKKCADQSEIQIQYFVEADQNIALARNKSIEHSQGGYVAFIDDDEFPARNWLLLLFQEINKQRCDGILGPVRAFYEQRPPGWIQKGRFYDKEPSFPNGKILDWQETRTSNALVRRPIFKDKDNRFDPKFGRGGEDLDLFKRLIAKGLVFRWSTDAIVFESVPAERCTRSFMLRRALLRGEVTAITGTYNSHDILKSYIAIFFYLLVIPPLVIIQHYIFMDYFIRQCEHVGKLLSILGFKVVKQKYVVN